MSKKIAVAYSFRLRYEKAIREVVVAAEQLLEIPLDVEAVRSAVEEDPALMKELFGKDLANYQNMAASPEIWSKNLQRFDEKIILTEIL